MHLYESVLKKLVLATEKKTAIKYKEKIPLIFHQNLHLFEKIVETIIKSKILYK